MSSRYNLLKLSFCQQLADANGCILGTFSLGGGIRFNDWTRLPEDFHISNTPFRFDFGRISDGGGTSGDNANSMNKDRSEGRVNCSAYGWQVRSGYLVFLPGPCQSILSFSVKLIQPGSVKFTYLYTDTDVWFDFNVRD